MPWVMAGLLYISLVSLAVAAVANAALHLYHLRGNVVTVALPQADDPAQAERELAAALEVVKGTRGVTSARLVAPDELERWIGPWLHEAAPDQDASGLQVINVRLDPLGKLDVLALQDRLRGKVASATVGLDAMSRDTFERQATFFRAWCGAISIIVLVGSLVVVVLSTRSSLKMQVEPIGLLRSMGAPDGYLARQFERHALLSGVHGGVLGFVLAVVTILAVLYSSRHMGLAGTVDLSLRPVDWILLACVPVVSALLFTALARATALWSLARMP